MSSPPAEQAELEAILADGSLRSIYQPIVELERGATVAYEALVRGPAGSALERPDQLFSVARSAGRLADLDWASRGAGVTGALAAGLTPPGMLFLNVEPEALGTPCPEPLAGAWARAAKELTVTVEITERALTARPAELLAALRKMRDRGWGVALDDVGADTRSLGLMPLLRPDVIKLDLRLVQEQPTAEIAAIVNAVNAQRERTGSVILAEGIETDRQLQTARAMGATLGQGWLFGRPAPLPSPLPVAPPPVPVADRSLHLDGGTPYRVVRAVRDVRRGDKRLLIALSKLLEQQAASLGAEAVIVAAFQTAERFTPATHRRYAALASRAAFVCALGVGMAPEPAPGVRGAELGPDDPLLGEWSVAVLGPHFAAALVAVDLGADGPDLEREFDFTLTYDRDLVIEATNSLMGRVLRLAEAESIPAA